MPVTYRVKVNLSGINRLTLPRGSGYRWLDQVKLQMHRAAQAAAPMRSGALVAAHRSRIEAGNQYYVQIAITNVSEHAIYVHEGTNGIPAGKWKNLPPGGPGRNTVSPYAGERFGRVVTKKRIRGQNANPWLDHACTYIAELHGGHVI